MYELYNCDFRNVFENMDKDIIIVTDPPYNIGFEYDTYKDNMPQEEYLQMISSLISNYPSVIIIYHEILHEITAYSQKIPDKVMEWIYPNNIRKHHRAIAYYGCKPDLEKVRQPYKNKNDPRIKKMISKGSKGARSYDWWHIPQVKGNSKERTKHPCQTPLKLMDNIIKVIPNNYVICDPFMGSGTTGVASLMNDRDFIGMEIEQSYFNIAEKRMKNILNTNPKKQEL